MKKLLPIIFAFLTLCLLSVLIPSSALAGCNPPDDYSDCPELHPDYNLDIPGYDPITGSLSLIGFVHPGDPNAPQLSTLIYGNPNPAVTSLYQLYYWNWATNSQGDPVPRPPDLPPEFDFATLVGFSTQPGQAILVPDSGYDIGGGYEVLVLFASTNSITLKYTRDDSVSNGYTIYLQNLQVDPGLLAYFNELNAAGRVELPALMAGMKIGEALGAEILIAIRDTGSFLDPRWLFDWWQALGGTLLDLMLAALAIQAPTPLACNPSDGGTPDSRPVPCDACNETDLLTPSCATTFTVHDSVKHRRGDADCFSGPPGDDAWVIRDWGGIVTIDSSEITIPFVGKKGMENEQKYLADYFEGTGYYYRPPYNLSSPAERRRVIEEGGVWRKLAPQFLQDEYKKEMVDRAIRSLAGTIGEGAIHDYIITYSGESARLSEFVNHFPPELGVENYQEKYEAWRRSDGGKWYRLWNAVPMFSREDTIGYIYPYLGAKYYDVFTILNPDAQIDKIPHLARLYEVTQAINKTLWPLIQEASQAQERIKTFLASAKETVSGEQTEIQSNQTAMTNSDEKKVLGEKRLLAQEKTFHLEASASYSAPNVNVTVCFVSDSCDGDVDLDLNGAHIAGTNGWNLAGGPFCYGPQWTGSPFIVNPGQSLSVMYTGHTSNSSCVNRTDTIICTFTVDAEGNFSTNCSGGVVPPPDACVIPPPLPVAKCAMDSITDTNPNDDICASPIYIDLYAKDSLKNPDYYECQTEPPYDCQQIPGCLSLCDPGAGQYECCECKDPCDRVVTRGVKRKIGINLLHPYLLEIWEYSTDLPKGFFNIFRPDPDIVPQFEELAGHSQDNLIYDYSSGSVTPPEGYFYYPYLGGVQKAKEWVVNKALHVTNP